MFIAKKVFGRLATKLLEQAKEVSWKDKKQAIKDPKHRHARTNFLSLDTRWR